MITQIKACIDRVLPDDLQDSMQQVAIEENPANLVAPEELNQAGITREIFLIKGKMWKPGRVLHVRFLDGKPEVQAKVAAMAQEWTKYANVQFIFDNAPDAEIRISFLQPGSWSFIGTDALLIPKDQPTMNYGWLTETTSDEEYSRVVLHEFGHALGAGHEHQNPADGIPWNVPAVMQYYQGPPNYWSEAQVRENLLKKYDKDASLFTDFDKFSIMLYPVQKELTLNGFEIPWSNSRLSEQDRAFIAKHYPKD